MNQTIKVTVDKSHLLTLGEKMYLESVEVIRELANNAYDADATEVYVTLSPEKIVIEDNGSGMNERGLSQFFTIGSEEKKINSVSPKFRRKRIGQFGIGKFAALAAADQFLVESKKGKWVYYVIFDKKEWQIKDKWELPIKKEPATPLHHEGTKVTLTKLKKYFSFKDVERCLKESVPLRAKKFTVYLNQKRITARFIPGRRYPFFFKTIYGVIDGEIVVALSSKLIEKPGIECRVRQALIKREFFDLEKTHFYGLNRISGEVNADFLPLLASRTDFVRDSGEYRFFHQLMKAELEKILKELKKESDSKNLKKVSQELKQALNMVRHALQEHPDLMPSGRIIALSRKRKGDLSASLAPKERKEQEKKEAKDRESPKKDQKNKLIEKKLPHPQIIKKIRIKKLGISVGIAPLGEKGQETYVEGNLVYVNSDHPLYKKFYAKKELLSLHLLRLITQEIVLMKKIRLPAREAYDLQSKLLTKSLIKEK